MALKCEATLSADELPRMPLFPGKRQRWLLVIRMSDRDKADPDPDRVASIVKTLFRHWLPIFPGPIGEPEVVGVTDGPTSSLVQPPALGFREPNATIPVEFDYMGTETVMRWPTFVARCRERIDALCPMKPTDSMPIAVENPEEEADDPEEVFNPPGPGAPGPLGLDVGPVDPDAFKLALGGGALLAGIGVGLVLVWASRKSRF